MRAAMRRFSTVFGLWSLGTVAFVGCGGSAFIVTHDNGGPADGSSANDSGATPDAGAQADGRNDVSAGDDATDEGTSDAAPVDGGADAPDATCVPGTITFEMQEAPGNTKSYCVGGRALSCATDWLSIRHGTSGASVSIDQGCVADCNSCQPVACPALCALPSRLPTAGVKRDFDGTYFAPGTCGAGLTCQTRSCAAPGRYVATMCAYEDVGGGEAGGCTSTAPTPTCVEVAFEWPPAGGSAVIVGTLKSTAIGDGGACCPTGWDLYSCTYPEGGTGFACHDPARLCAGSLTCGVGCDFIVTGRCADSG
jgi:hypothetical protein